MEAFIKWRAYFPLFTILLLFVSCSQADQEIATEQTLKAEKVITTPIAGLPATTPASTPTQPETQQSSLGPTSNSFEELDGLTIELLDLPDVFIEVDPSEMALSEESIRSDFFTSGCKVAVGDIFTFVYRESFNLIYGWTVFTHQTLCFDEMVEYTSEELMNLPVNEGEILEERLLLDVQNIGETSMGTRVAVDHDDWPVVIVLDSIVFRRNNYLSYIYLQYAHGDTPLVSIDALGKIVDQKIIDAIGN